MSPDRRQQSTRLLAATALLLTAAALAWPDPRPAHTVPSPSPGISPAPLETAP